MQQFWTINSKCPLWLGHSKESGIADLPEFIGNLQHVLQKLGRPYQLNDRSATSPSYFGPTMNFHQHTFSAWSWNYKESYIKGYIQLDQFGYSGWAKGVLNSAELHAEVDSIELNAFWQSEVMPYLSKGSSKYQQNDEPFEVAGDYVFLALQLRNDMVARFCRFSMGDVILALAEFCQSKNMTLVIKRHPYCDSTYIEQRINLAQQQYGCVVLTAASIHRIIPGAKAVFINNSGVGFEALMHLRPVVTLAQSDYSSATSQIHNLDQLDELDLEALDSQAQRLMRRRFVYNYVKRCLIKVSDYDAIEKFVYDAERVFASHLPERAIQPLPERLEFTSDSGTDAFILRGISFQEIWGRWTEGNSSALIFRFNPKPHRGINPFKKSKCDFKLKIKLRAYLTDKSHLIHAVIKLNDQYVRDLTMKTGMGDTFVELDLSKWLDEEVSIYVLEFLVTNPVRPADIDSSLPDIRRIGLGLLEVNNVSKSVNSAAPCSVELPV